MMISNRNSTEPVRPRRSFVATFLIVFTVLATGVLTPTSTLASPQAEALVKKFGNKIIKILASNASVSQQKKRFRSAFLRNADIKRIGTFTLGKYARKIKTSERREFNQLFDRFIVKVFIDRMRGSKSTGLKILGTTELKKGRDFLVKSLVNLPDGAPIRVNWRVFKNKKGRLKIFDMRIGGLWLAQEQKSVFVSVISRNNGKISALLTHLKQRIAK